MSEHKFGTITDRQNISKNVCIKVLLSSKVAHAQKTLIWAFFKLEVLDLAAGMFLFRQDIRYLVFKYQVILFNLVTK